jgi:thiosulfate dehydrogenase [quinone] large subunit
VSATAATPAAATPAVPVSRELEGTAKASWGYTLLGLTRLMVGFTFLWAFLDKVFGLGFSTPTEHSWLHGGSPTSGFLVASIEGGNPFAGVWSVFLAINPVTDVLFMLGLLGVGLALMLGIGTRVAAVSGAAMYTLMYLAAFPMSTNPLYDTHLLLAVLELHVGDRVDRVVDAPQAGVGVAALVGGDLDAGGGVSAVMPGVLGGVREAVA